MKLALIVSFLVMSIVLNAQTLQGKVVRVADGDTIHFAVEIINHLGDEVMKVFHVSGKK